MRGVGDEPEGTLRVVAPHALGQLLLVGPLADYLRAYPRVSVEWLLNDRRPDFIAEGVDCAIQVGEVTDTMAVAIKLSEVPRVVVAAPSVLAGRTPPTHASELAELPWLALRTFYRNEVVLTHSPSGEVAHVPIRPRMSTDSLYALQSAARMGLGACMGSAWLLKDDIATGRMVQLVPQWHVAALPVYLIYPHARFQPARLRRFIEMMRLALADPTGRAWEAGAS